MLAMRQSQMEAFGNAALGKFEDDMVLHLRQFAPRHCEVIGEPAVRRAIRLGTERARKYGLTNRGPVRFYIELMFMYGCDFDTDIQCAWAARVLNNRSFAHQMAKADELYKEAMAFTGEIAGKDYVYAKDALRRVHQSKFEDLPVLDAGFDAKMLERLKQIHPEKVRALGEPKTIQVIAYAKALPGKLSLAPERGAAICAGAMFALGHGFGHDPLLPWIEHTINNTAITDSQTRAKRLHARIMTYLDHIIDGFNKSEAQA